VETQPNAGFGFSLIYFYFTYIIYLASKYAPTVPANHYPTSYAHPCEPVRPSGQNPVSRGIRLVLISTTYYPLDPRLGYSTYTLISLSQQLFYSKIYRPPTQFKNPPPRHLALPHRSRRQYVHCDVRIALVRGIQH
jgi:hypothetical protein